MRCQAKLLAMVRSTLCDNSFCSSQAHMATLTSSASVQSAIACRRLSSLSILGSHRWQLTLQTRAGHAAPSSLSTTTDDKEWASRDLSSAEWPLSNSGESGTDAVLKEGEGSATSPDEEWYRIQAEDDDWFRREEQFYETRISEQEEWAKPCSTRQEAQPDFLALSESSLFSQCRMDTFRASGPGGQHRNKTDSGVRLTHLPTGVVAQAVDDRSQHKNRAVAMNRLRVLIASKVRRPVKLEKYKPPPELLRLLPPEPGRKGGGDKIGVNHPDFAKGIQALLDLLSASKGYVFYAAAVLGVSPNILSKILTMDKTVLQATNELLISKGQKPFK